MRPILKSVLIRQIEVEKESKEGILIADTPEADYRVRKAEVVAIGEKVECFKSGDIVFYRKFSADDLDIDGEKLFVIEENDVVLVV